MVDCPECGAVNASPTPNGYTFHCATCNTVFDKKEGSEATVTWQPGKESG